MARSTGRGLVDRGGRVCEAVRTPRDKPSTHKPQRRSKTAAREGGQQSDKVRGGVGRELAGSWPGRARGLR